MSLSSGPLGCVSPARPDERYRRWNILRQPWCRACRVTSRSEEATPGAKGIEDIENESLWVRWLSLRDRRLGRGSGFFRTPAFERTPCDEDEVASALQHRFHLRNAESPLGELGKIAVAKEFAEGIPVGSERAIRIGDQITKKFLRRAMGGTNRESFPRFNRSSLLELSPARTRI